jgi:phage shock protein E
VISLFKRLLGLDAPRIATLAPLEVQARVQRGSLLLDVRSSAERHILSIPRSTAIPLEQLTTRWETLPKDREIICQCASGMRSAQAARFLARQGFDAANLGGGIRAWQTAGLPVKRGQGHA